MYRLHHSLFLRAGLLECYTSFGFCLKAHEVSYKVIISVGISFRSHCRSYKYLLTFFVVGGPSARFYLVALIVAFICLTGISNSKASMVIEEIAREAWSTDTLRKPKKSIVITMIKIRSTQAQLHYKHPIL